MTAPDTLERIADRVRGIANSIANDSEPIDRTLLVAKLYAVISKIEALIPSKAEREFLEAAMAHGDRGCADGDEAFMPAYRALLAERGKDA